MKACRTTTVRTMGVELGREAVTRRAGRACQFVLFLVTALFGATLSNAHNLDQRDTSITFDSAYIQTMAGRASLGQTLVQTNDTFWLILKSTPGPGTLTGVGGYLTYYIPEGVEIQEVGYLTPTPGTAGDTHNPPSFTRIALKGQSIIAIGSGPIGPATTTDLIGLSLTNAFGQAETAVTGAGVHRGTIAGVYADTGIFYSSDPRTAWQSWSNAPATGPLSRLGYPISMVNNRGETIVPITRYDAEQLIAYGRSDVAPVVDPNGRGNTPWGLGNVVSGPESGYAWQFNLNTWLDTADRKRAVTNIGPWHRIKYPGSQYAQDQAGLVSSALGYAGRDASDLGYPLGTEPGETPLLPGDANAIRIAYGMLELGRPEYAAIKVRIVTAPASECFTMYTDAFGGDAGGEQGGKDHEWRYYDPTTASLSPCTFLSKTASDPLVKPGDMFYYDIVFANNGNVPLPGITLTDTLPAGIAYVSAVPAPSSGPTPLVWNLGTVATNSLTRIRVNVKATSLGTFVNSVVATSGTNFVSRAEETVEVSYKALLRGEKTVSPSSVAPGGTVTYTLTLHNDGTGPNGVPLVITEFLPPGFTFVNMVSQDINGAPLAPSFLTVNSSNPNQPKFTVGMGIGADRTLVLKFNVLVSASQAVGEYNNSFNMTYEGKVVSTPPQAPVTVGGGQIGDFIWRDWDGDGSQDSGEEGMTNVTVSLYIDVNNNGTNDVGDVLVGTKTTDATGYYLFTGLQVTNYVVVVPAPGSGGVPSGYALTGDPVGATNGVAGVALTNSTQSVLTVDFGYRPGGSGSIGDQVFEDLNKNGTWDTGEPGISNVTVRLYEDSNGNGVIDSGDVLVATNSTTTTGSYSFTGLATNLSYIADVDQTDADIGAYFTAKYGSSANTGTSTDPRPVAGGFSSVTNADFGFWRDAPATVGDQLFHDVNRDGIYSNTVDLPLANVTVQLYASDGTTLLATTTSSVSGVYSFTGLSPATYVVKVDTTDPDIPAYLVASVSQYTGVALTAGLPDNTRDFPFASLLDKTVNKSTATTNEALTFTITPHYPGSEALTNVTVTDVVPAGTTFTSAGQGGANSPPGTVTWTLGSTTTKSDGTTTISGNSTISHVASSTATGTGGSLSPGAPGGTAVNDVLIAALSWDSSGGATIAAPSGWTRIGASDTEVSATSGASTIQQRGSQTTATGTTGLSINKPAGLQIGDLMVANIFARGSGGTHQATGPESGWKRVGFDDFQGGGSQPTITVLYRVVDGTEGTGPYTFTFANTTSETAGQIVAFQGVDLTGGVAPGGGAGPLDVAPGSFSRNTGGSTSVSASQITTASANALLLMFEANQDSATTVSFTAPTILTSGGGGVAATLINAAGTVAMAWGTKATAGATGAGAATLGTSRRWSSILLALKPASTTIKHKQAAYYRVYTGSEGAGWNTFTMTGSAKWSIGFSAYRGVDTASPIRANAANANTPAGTASATGSITPAVGDMLVGIFASKNSTQSGTGTAGPPTSPNMTERIDISTGTTGTSEAGLETCDLTSPGSSSVSKTATLTASTISVGHLIALKQAPWSYNVVTSLSANRSLVTSNDSITVTMTLRATTVSGSPPFPITVSPGALSVTGTSGASATFTTPGAQSLSSGVDATFAYTSTAVTAGSTPGSLTLRATPSDTYGTWAQAAANTVLVTPPLTFTSTVNTPPGVNVVTNQARIYTNGALLAVSPVTSTALIGSIGDYVWLDSDADGVQDTGEPGIAGVRVYVDTNGNGQYDVGETNAITDSSGLYRVYGFAAGTYAVRYDYSTVPSGYLPTTPVLHSATLATGTTQYNNADFGLRAPGAASIGDTVWLDANTNGVRDAAESGLTNITVRLYFDANTNGVIDGGDFLLQSTATDTNGNYLFSGLTTNTYLVQVEGASLVPSPYDGSSALSNAMSLVSGTAPHAVTLTTTSQVYTNADFGYNWTGVIGDYVWWDANRNQTPDGGELPVTNAFVMLYYDVNTNGILDVLNGDVQIATTTTDTNGYYYFRQLPPGPYLVDVYEDSIAVGGVVPTTPNSRYVNLGAGQTNLTADFGYYLGARIEGNVFWDANRDSIFAGAETGLTNVTVYLTGYDMNGIAVSLTNQTDALGHFYFVAPEGDYTLSYSIPGLLAQYPALQDPTTVTSYTLHAYPGENMNPTFDFGVDNTGIIGDTIFGDINTNAVQDVGEAGLEGVVVVLYDAATNALDSAITDALGHYRFLGLADGAYHVQVLTNSLPSGYQLIPTYDPTAPLDGWGTTNIVGGNTVLTLDFGYPPMPGPLYTVSGSVFYDANTNGTNNAEAGISNVTVNVSIDTDNDGTNDVFYAVVTATNGTYSVAGIPSNSTVTITVSQGTLPSVGYQATTTNTLVVSHISANATNQDFGFYESLGSISGTVVVGANGNGLADLGELALSNVTVTLRYAGSDGILNTGDDVVTTTSTDSSGNYTFGALLPGVYQVVKSSPPGYLDLADADGGNANNITVTLALGQNTIDRDFEVYQPGAIGDRVWLDEDGDGVQDAGEAGIANVTVSLLDTNNAVVATTVTDSDGRYLFPDLLTGIYTVTVATNTMAAGLVANQTFDPDATTNHATTVTLAAGQEVTTADFGYNWATTGDVTGNTGTGAIGDRVWIDANGDGVQDPGEPGMESVSVTLVNLGVDGVLGTADDTTNTTTTAADGRYLFDGLMAGAYQVTVNGGSAPTNTTATGDPDGVFDNRSTTPIVLAPGDVYVNADFGYQPATGYGATIGDQVWFDANADGSLNGSETGIAGVSVALIRDSNGNGVWNAGEPIIATTVTGTNGVYGFAGVPVADGVGTDDYLVWVNDAGSVLVGLRQTYDANGVGTANLSAVANLTAADNLLQDFGYTMAGQMAGQGLIGDTIYLDRNTNGVFEAGEGIEGVVVRLTDTNGVLLATTVTDENGQYHFGGLSTNNAAYVVQVDTNTLPGTLGQLTNTVDPDGGTANQSTVTLTGANPIRLDQDFGYADQTNPNVISGTIWTDTNADGVQGASETNGYAGVTVTLYDTNGNAVATTVTDASGNYAFSGVPDGTYRVDVTDTASVLEGAWHTLGSQNVASNGTSKADAYTVSVTGGQTVDTVDFGYYTLGGSLGNRVWWDVNADGLQSTNDAGIILVKVTLKVVYSGGVTNWVVTRTDTNGTYSFGYLLLDENLSASGAGAPVFILSATTTNAIYSPTLVNVGGDIGTNDWLDSDAHGGVTGLVVRGEVDMVAQVNPVDEPSGASYDFGYKFKPTLVRVTGFGAMSRGDQVVLFWETAEEKGTLGFWLERWVDGEYRRVNQDLIPGRIFAVDAAVYEQVDPGAVAGGRYTYRLIEVETSGNLLYLGPYTVEVGGSTLSFDEWSRAAFDTAELLNPSVSGLDADPDGDGADNFAEFVAGTSPTNSYSALRMKTLSQDGRTVVVEWPSETARVYRVERTAQLIRGFETVPVPIPATPPYNTYTDCVERIEGALYYRIRVE